MEGLPAGEKAGLTGTHHADPRGASLQDGEKRRWGVALAEAAEQTTQAPAETAGPRPAVCHQARCRRQPQLLPAATG